MQPTKIQLFKLSAGIAAGLQDSKNTQALDLCTQLVLGKPKDRRMEYLGLASAKETHDCTLLLFEHYKHGSLLNESAGLLSNGELSYMQTALSSCHMTENSMNLLFQKTLQVTSQKGSAVNSLRRQAKEDRVQREVQRKADQIAKNVLSLGPIPITGKFRDSGLSDEEISILKKHSAGVHDIINFLKNIVPNLHGKQTVLGLNLRETITGLSEALEGEDYIAALDRMFHSFKENMELLPRLAAEDHPTIFLVPPQLFGHDSEGATAREMRWYLGNPDKLKNIHFIFGAYDVVPSGSKEEIKLPFTVENIDSYEDYLAHQTFLRVMGKKLPLQSLTKAEKIFRPGCPDYMDEAENNLRQVRGRLARVS